MRVGFVTQLLWDRYGPFWTRLAAAAGSECVLPERSAVIEALNGDERVIGVADSSFRLAAAQAVTLADCDLIVVPELNAPSDVERGSALDRWAADFPGALADAVPGLPELRAVPTDVDEHVEGYAALLLSRLVREPAAVERVWSKHKALVASGRWRDSVSPSSAGSGGGKVSALVAKPWAVTDAVIAALQRVIGEPVHIVDARRLKPERLREVGGRLEPRLLPTDAEVIGAARVLSGRNDVARLIHLVDDASVSDAWLARRVKEHSLKSVDEVAFGSLLSGDLTMDDLIELPVE